MSSVASVLPGAATCVPLSLKRIKGNHSVRGLCNASSTKQASRSTGCAPATPQRRLSQGGASRTRWKFSNALRPKKKYFDRPHPWFQNNDALKCCARVVAILQSASKRNAYYMAMWKLGAALDALQKEFGHEPGAELTIINKQVDLLKPVVEHGRTLIREGAKRIAALKRLTDRQTKRPSKKKKPRRS
jgi:hypothetical protein